MVYLQVNALSEWIIRIYLHEFNEREISILHEATECSFENFEFIGSERVQVNPDNSRAMSALKGQSHELRMRDFLPLGALTQ